jgi:hypothetical protein
MHIGTLVSFPASTSLPVKTHVPTRRVFRYTLAKRSRGLALLLEVLLVFSSIQMGLSAMITGTGYMADVTKPHV